MLQICTSHTLHTDLRGMRVSGYKASTTCRTESKHHELLIDGICQFKFIFILPFLSRERKWERAVPEWAHSPSG